MTFLEYEAGILLGFKVAEHRGTPIEGDTGCRSKE